MIGSNGPRMLGIALPHVHLWNTWYVDYGNSPEGFAALNKRISEAARLAGRDPAEIERSACVYLALDGADAGRASTPEAPPLAGSPDRLASRLSEFAEAGADEAILVVNPITERSIRELGAVLALVRRA
jgi:alkanesulfonate monooxygenase SsuD/methylene tetrahydromethanopterin reductase-like flavin-dependent oxidoreductase (luciferase family)